MPPNAISRLRVIGKMLGPKRIGDVNAIAGHGIVGWRTAYPEVYRVPLIGGQHEAYLVKALQEYKSGERTHPSMRAIAASLSDQDMADLAAYYAQDGVKTAAK